MLLARIFRFGVRIQMLVSLSDPFISVMNSTRPRSIVFSKGTLLNTIRTNTVTFKNGFCCRAPRIWNTLPAHLRNTDCSVAHFKKDLFNYYLYLTKSVYDVDTPQTFKSVYIKCHTSRPLISLLDRMCCCFFIDVFRNSVFALAFLFLSFLSIVILVSCITNFLLSFSGTRSGDCSVSDPGLLAKFINKYKKNKYTMLFVNKERLEGLKHNIGFGGGGGGT